MKNKKKITKILILLLAVSLIVPFFSGCGNKASTQYLVDLEIWGVFDDADDYVDLISEYRKINPFVGNISYKKFTIENYREDVIDALASGNGPDIFMINNSWVPRFEDKVAVAPEYLINEQQFRNNFVDAAIEDFVGQSGEIYGVPMSVDSLALYYNKDLFNAAGIATPPASWEELVEDSKKITKVNNNGEIERSGVALGTAYNINRSSDIANLLLIQHGARLPSRDNMSFDVNVNLGNDALEFYTQFARSSSPAYSWNKAMHYSIDSFYEGDLAMMLNYSWHIETLRSKNAKLNFAVSNIPQLSKKNPVNNANYWSFVVNKNKETDNSLNDRAPISNEERIHEAWEFLKFISFKHDNNFNIMNIKSRQQKALKIDTDPTQMYLEKTKKPAARRDLVENQKSDPILGAFAYGNLVAKSWYRKDSDAVESIWAEVINSVNNGDISASKGFNLIRSRINEVNR